MPMPLVPRLIRMSIHPAGLKAWGFLLMFNKIVIGTQYAQGYFPEIIVDRDNLKEIIEKWEQLKKANSDEIVLKRDGDKVYIIGRTLTEEEKLEQDRILKLWQDTPQDLK